MLGSRFSDALGDFASARSGAVAAETALVLPLMTFVLYAIIRFGAAYNADISLTDAARMSVRELAVGRESATVYTDTMARFNSAAGFLDTSKAVVTMKINNTTCASNATCQTLMNGASGQTARLEASYPCNLKVVGVDFAPGCMLSANIAQRIE
ncbi:TadE/TadG family type IV pilus assembly protein [Sandarakinorhabdus sp.]|uniref:TadE/TadG family type IV pilus assembly protein n=1 Tax=Sandarakinorhabdus sp. TaxID=1916663 RepID=UPI00286E932F|nr:TadE/TadG family type IV pilus assembly protein [Sandarakinorhabdus sp.]